MAMLTGKTCGALVAQALLVNYLCADDTPEYCGCCGKFVWPNGEPEEWDVTWHPAP